jgi:hypothetical protein
MDKDKNTTIQKYNTEEMRKKSVASPCFMFIFIALIISFADACGFDFAFQLNQNRDNDATIRKYKPEAICKKSVAMIMLCNSFVDFQCADSTSLK